MDRLNQKLDYQSPEASRRYSWLAVGAFVVSLLGCPFLRIIELVDSIPILLLPVTGAVLGIAAMIRIRFSSPRRRGIGLAWLSFVFTLLWAFAFVMLWLLIGRHGLPHP